MFSGKTEELIRRLVRARYAKQDVLIFKPKIDTRYAEGEIVSHSKMSLKALRVEKAEDVWKAGKGTQVVAIDEVQFFDEARFVDEAWFVEESSKSLSRL